MKLAGQQPSSPEKPVGKTPARDILHSRRLSFHRDLVYASLMAPTDLVYVIEMKVVASDPLEYIHDWLAPWSPPGHDMR